MLVKKRKNFKKNIPVELNGRRKKKEGRRKVEVEERRMVEERLTNSSVSSIPRAVTSIGG